MRQPLALFLSFVLVLLPVMSCGGGGAASGPADAPETPNVPLQPAVFEPLNESLKKSYLQLFDEAATLEFRQTQLEEMGSYVEGAREFCVTKFENKQKRYEEELEQTQQELKEQSPSLSEEERHQKHCRIQNLRVLKSQAQTLTKHSNPGQAFDPPRL